MRDALFVIRLANIEGNCVLVFLDIGLGAVGTGAGEFKRILLDDQQLDEITGNFSGKRTESQRLTLDEPPQTCGQLLSCPRHQPPTQYC